MSKLSRQFYSRIGEKGGRAGKWSPAKRESARNAARIRWQRQRWMQIDKHNAAKRDASSLK